ncbi:MAG: hypothetical protein M3Q65_06785, partial [Chloroflexota bacterium]|nr:hypothetical protein [Chloroflexota bacterium]
AWGANGSGQAGAASGDSCDQSVACVRAPTRVPGLGGVTAIAASGSHNLALMADGGVWAWGANDDGQLGSGDRCVASGAGCSSATPVRVRGLTDVKAVAAGGDTNTIAHSLALRADGTVWAWGSNFHGQLGDGSTTNSAVPVQARGLGGIVAIAAGDGYSLAVGGNGVVWAWGVNHSGQLGDGVACVTTGLGCVAATPGQIRGPGRVAAVAAGNGYALARDADGALWAWGLNDRGQLGDGSTAASRAAVRVRGLSDAVAMATGYSYSLALTADGAVWAWGANEFGARRAASDPAAARVATQGGGPDPAGRWRGHRPPCWRDRAAGAG